MFCLEQTPTQLFSVVIFRRGERRVFVEAMKNFKHVLMDPEMFLKIFDGPQNIFSCSPLVNLIFKLSGSEKKMSKLAIKEI